MDIQWQFGQCSNQKVGLQKRKRENSLFTIGYFENQSADPKREINFDKTSELIIKNGEQIALTKFAIPGRCWQGYFTDLDNNTFGIFEVNTNAKKGLTKNKEPQIGNWQKGDCGVSVKLLC